MFICCLCAVFLLQSLFQQPPDHPYRHHLIISYPLPQPPPLFIDSYLPNCIVILHPPHLHNYPVSSPSPTAWGFRDVISLLFMQIRLTTPTSTTYCHAISWINLLLFQAEQISLTTHTFPTKIMGAEKEGWGQGGSSLVKIVVLIFVNFILPPENWYKQKITPKWFQWFVNFRLCNFINAFCGTNLLSVIFWLMCWLSLDTLWFVG